MIDVYVHAFVRDWRSSPLSAADKALCYHAEKLTNHQDRIDSADIEVLCLHGSDDRAIHNATQVIGLFYHYYARRQWAGGGTADLDKTLGAVVEWR